MKLDIKALLKYLEPIKKFLGKYGRLLVIFAILCLFSFLIYRITYFNSVKPSDDTVDEQLKNLQRPRIDKAMAEKLQNLEHDNIQVQTLFNQARDNPFNEQ